MKKWLIRKLGGYLKQQVNDIAVYLWLHWSEDGLPGSLTEALADAKQAIKYVAKHGRPKLVERKVRDG